MVQNGLIWKRLSMEEILQVLLSSINSLLVLESVGRQIPAHVHDYF